MKNFLVLRLLDKAPFRRLLEAAGADYPMFRTILQVKLTMDARKLPTVLSGTARAKRRDQNAGSGEKKDRNLFLQSMWIYGLFGLILIPFVLIGDHYLLQMSLVFGMMMFMVATSLISDFSSVLLDIRDKHILHTRPVGKRTIGLAKLVHILNYLFQLTGILTGPAWVAGTIRHGLVFGLLFLVLVALSVMLLLILTALVYLLILTFYDGEKLKDLINYVQIGLSFTITVGYQLIGRAFSFTGLDAVFHPKWWEVAVIPLWYGAAFEWVLNGERQTVVSVFALLAVVVPLAGLLVYIRLMPLFERYLQKLSEHQSGSVRRTRPSLVGWIGNLVCRTPLERACFRFALKMMGQEREFKLKVYPTLGFSIIFPFIFLFNSLRESGLSGLADSKAYLTVYFGVMVAPGIITMLQYSGRYKGAWIFQVSPLQDCSPYLRAVLKAFLLRLLLPINVVQGAIYIAIFGWRVLPDMLAILAVSLVYAAICYLLFPKTLPFSVPFSVTQQQNLGRTFLLLGLLAGFGGVHVAVTFIPYGVWIYLGVLFVMNVVLWRVAFPKRGIGVRELAGEGFTFSG